MKAVFFDFDGTLTTHESDTKVHRNIFRKARDRLNIDWDEEDIINKVKKYEDLTSEYFYEYSGERYVPSRFLSSRGFEDILREEEIDYSKEDVEWFQNLHIDQHIKHSVLRESAIEVLENIKDNKKYLGIITNSDSELSLPRIEKLGIKDYMDFIITADQAGYYKPHPKPFELSLDKIDIPSSECMYVGDNPETDSGSQGLGMNFTLVNTKDKVDVNGADYVIKDLRELLDVI